MQVPRNYHSFALLQKDGRVIAGGGGLCGGCSANHPDVEILSPPYLFNANGTPATRPVIRSAPANAAPGNNLTVLMDKAVNHKFALVRLASATHSVNNDQRRVPLTSRSLGGGQFSVSIPGNRNVVLPGNYFLFAFNDKGVPSVAQVVNIR